MKDQYVLKQEDFDGLLALFSEDRDEAGRIYERTRNGLIRFFQSKGCHDAQQLADITLNRVASKASTFDRSANIKPTTFVYGFASKIYLEQRRVVHSVELIYEPGLGSGSTGRPDATDPKEESLDCLDECLSKLSVEDRDLVITYYSREKQDRIDIRKKLADSLGCKPEVLHMKVFRIRTQLRECVKKCRLRKSR